MREATWGVSESADVKAHPFTEPGDVPAPVPSPVRWFIFVVTATGLGIA